MPRTAIRPARTLTRPASLAPSFAPCLAPCLALAIASATPLAASAQGAPGADVRAAIEAALAAGYGGSCGEAPAGDQGREIESFVLSYTPGWSDEPRSATAYRALCTMGAYNAVHAWFLDEGYGLAPIAFAEPNLAIRYRDENQETLKSIAVDGWRGVALLVNSDLDRQKAVMTTYSAWRGLGDAFSSARYVFEDGAFVLVRFDVDPTYDGTQDPLIVFERE